MFATIASAGRSRSIGFVKPGLALRRFGGRISNGLAPRRGWACPGR
jgi:hypothetical protein